MDKWKDRDPKKKGIWGTKKIKYWRGYLPLKFSVAKLTLNAGGKIEFKIKDKKKKDEWK
jgi:hypothetical protein